MSHIKYISYLGLAATSGSLVSGLLYLNACTVDAMKESPKAAASHLLANSGNDGKILKRHHLETLKRDGLVVLDNVLIHSAVQLAKSEVDDLIAGNEFGANGNEDTDIRSDSVHWISESIGKEQFSSLTPGLLLALRLVRSIPYELERSGLFDDITLGVPLSNQLACYNGEKSFYAAHRDCPEANDDLFSHPLQWILRPGLMDREITIILYLNDETWESSSGEITDSGNLKCYLDTDLSDPSGLSASSIRNIEPIGGRMVIMNSKNVLHEVRPSVHRRRAITCWAGGSHSKYNWMRPFCIEPGNVDWVVWKKSLFS